MNPKSEVCRVMIAQEMADYIAGGMGVEEAGRNTVKWLKEDFQIDLVSRSLAQAARREAAKAADPKPVTNVTKPTYTKEEKTFIDRATYQAKHEVAAHRNMAGELGPLPDSTQAALKARSAISYLQEILPDDPGRLEALWAVAEYLDSQGIGFSPDKPETYNLKGAA